MHVDPHSSKLQLPHLKSIEVAEVSLHAHVFTRQSIAEGLCQARAAARITQAELAARMGKSQTLISQAESDTVRVSERYVAAVLDACGLPRDWNGATPGKRQTKIARVSPLQTLVRIRPPR